MTDENFDFDEKSNMADEVEEKHGHYLATYNGNVNRSERKSPNNSPRLGESPRPGESPRSSQSRMYDGMEYHDGYRPDWKYWPKTNSLEIPKDTGKLPPIDLGWQAKPMIGSLSNLHHKPGGGDKLIFDEKIKWKSKARVDSLQNFNYPGSQVDLSDPSSPRVVVVNKYYIPGVGEIPTVNKKFVEVSPKINSLENMSYSSRGGNVVIPNQHLSWKGKARVGSLENIHYHPETGEVYIMNQTVKWRAKAKVGSLENINHQPRTTIGAIPNLRENWDGSPRVGSLENIHHTPRGGNVVIPTWRLNWRPNARPHYCHIKHDHAKHHH